MQLDFFPSKTLTLYMMRLFVVRIVSMLAVLVLVLMMLDLLGNSGKILAHPGNGEAELWDYVCLRVPQLISRFLPYSVLLATLIALVTLNQNSEVIAMKAAGLSAHQVLAPLLLTALGVSALSFGFNEAVVTHSTATLKAWEKNGFGPAPKDANERANMYFTDGAHILMAKKVHGMGPEKGENFTMEGVTWYERDPNGMLSQKADAPRAVYTGNAWKMEDVSLFDVATLSVRRLPALEVGKGISEEQIALDRVDADAEPLHELYASIGAYEAAGRDTGELRAKMLHKISGPLSAFLMPLLGSIAAFGLARSGQLFVRAIIGMALGFAYFVMDTAALALGNFGGYPPILAAWAPFFLFLFIGELVLIKTEE